VGGGGQLPGAPGGAPGPHDEDAGHGWPEV